MITARNVKAVPRNFHWRGKVGMGSGKGRCPSSDFFFNLQMEMVHFGAFVLTVFT